jgi:hypothetical protein
MRFCHQQAISMPIAQVAAFTFAILCVPFAVSDIVACTQSFISCVAFQGVSVAFIQFLKADINVWCKSAHRQALATLAVMALCLEAFRIVDSAAVSTGAFAGASVVLCMLALKAIPKQDETYGEVCLVPPSHSTIFVSYLLSAAFAAYSYSITQVFSHSIQVQSKCEFICCAYCLVFACSTSNIVDFAVFFGSSEETV